MQENGTPRKKRKEAALINSKFGAGEKCLLLGESEGWFFLCHHHGHCTYSLVPKEERFLEEEEEAFRNSSSFFVPPPPL